jgi:uncharacterized protein (DUF983 family)
MPRTISLPVLLARAARKRCPHCGAKGLFRRWLTMVPVCPGCGLRFEREEGGWLGSVVLNLGATQLVVVAYLVVGLIATWPDPPMLPLIAGGALGITAFAVWFNPYSKTIWVAFELWMRPTLRDDADAHRAR